MNTAIVVLFALVCIAVADVGVDVSQPCMPSSFQCMVNNGYSFTIIRVNLDLECILNLN
jgi:hypothetical protein